MPEPLFILAPPRSFTSVVCGMIGQHPDMLGLPEVNLFAADDYHELTRIYQLRPRFQHGLLRAITELGLGEQTDSNVEVARQWLAETPERSTAGIFQDLSAWASPKGLVDKSPMYVYTERAMERIDQAFPNARYLHLLRHPRATCESIHALRNKMGGEGMKPLDPETAWLKPQLRILEFLETIPSERHLQIRGEDLLSDPDCYLPQIAQWLRLDASPDAIDAMRHPERSVFACYGPSHARYGNDPSFLEQPRLRPYHPPALSLEGPLSWDSSLLFSDTLKHYALFFGYE
jgi:hypothetical protein